MAVWSVGVGVSIMVIVGRLYQWSVVRSGLRMTVSHSTGKITGITEIRVIDGDVIAIGVAGVSYVLHVS